jgi:hypothetical protein
VSDAKFRWFEAMNHDEKIPLAQRGVLGYCGIRYAMESEGYLIKVRQETIAANLGSDVKTVKRAFAAGRNRGWLIKSVQGQRGRGHHEPDTHVLAMQDGMGDSPGTHSDKWGTQESEMGDSHVRDGAKWGTHMSEMGDSANAATSENAALQGLDTGFSNYQGFKEQGVAPARDPLFDGLFSSPKPPKPPAPKRIESKRVDIEEVAAGPPCDVCASRPAVEDGKCGQCLCVAATQTRPPPLAVPAIQESMEEKRTREIARLRAAYPDEDTA